LSSGGFGAINKAHTQGTYPGRAGFSPELGALRLISRGKTAERGDVLCPGGGSELTVMMMFRENFHVAADGANWLKDHSAQLAEAEVQIEKIRKRVEANFCDAETSVKLAEADPPAPPPHPRPGGPAGQTGRLRGPQEAGAGEARNREGGSGASVQTSDARGATSVVITARVLTVAAVGTPASSKTRNMQSCSTQEGVRRKAEEGVQVHA